MSSKKISSIKIVILSRSVELGNHRYPPMNMRTLQKQWQLSSQKQVSLCPRRIWAWLIACPVETQQDQRHFLLNYDQGLWETALSDWRKTSETMKYWKVTTRMPSLLSIWPPYEPKLHTNYDRMIQFRGFGQLMEE